MAFQLSDGKGKGHLAEVNEEQELVVRAIVESEIEHASAILGSAFSWDSTELDIATGGTMIFVKNTGDIPLILDRASIVGSNVICTWTILIGADTTTPTRTTVTPVNIHPTFSTTPATAVSFSDETAVSDGSLIDRIKTAVNDSRQITLTGIILGKNQYVQFNQITESTSGSIVLFGHFASPS